MMAHTNTLKRPSFRTAFNGSPLVNRIFERDCESTSSLSTTPSACDESLSSSSSTDTTMHPNIAHVSSPQTCMQLTTLPVFRHDGNWSSSSILSNGLLGWMPIQAMPFANSAYMGPVGVQTSTIQPKYYVNGITMHQVNGPGWVCTSINVPLAHHISGPKNYTPHPGIQDTKSSIHSSLNGIPLDAYATGNNPLVPSGNISSPVVVYHAASDQTIGAPATQMTNTMPPCAVRPSSNATPMARLNSTPNLESYTLPNHGTRNITSASLSSRQKKGATPAAHASHSVDICGKQSEADTALNQAPLNNLGEQYTKGNEPWKNEGDDIWVGECRYEEFQREGCSNLFVTWHGSHMELVKKFGHLQLDVEIIYRTVDPRVYNVVFKTHAKARRAFCLQKEIRLRMVPPKQSPRNWIRNPSPTYVVKFETKLRTIARRGKSLCQEIVGTFLMSNFSERKGCIIWADQLKGNRIRIVGCEGRFMYPDGTIKYVKKPPSKGAKPIGWVSYRSRETKGALVLRRSGNTISEYLYCE